MNEAQKGRLVVIEGLDGSGKATQTGKLYDRLTARDVACRRLTFPNYQSQTSALVKLYLAGELGGLGDVNAYGASLFYTVDRYGSFLQDWGRDYRAGGIILSDRYATSNIPHQMSKLPREQWEDYLRWLDDLEYSRVGLPRPDRVVYLDMHPETSRRLLAARYQGDESKKDLHEADFDYLLRCREAALYGADKLGWRVLRCCDGHNPLPIEVIAGQVWAAVADILDETGDEPCKTPCPQPNNAQTSERW